MSTETKGQLFFLVGNSGSGKDSLLAEALKLWPKDLPTVKISVPLIKKSETVGCICG